MNGFLKLIGIKKIIILLLLFFIFLMFMFPIYWILVTSLKENKEIYHLPLTFIPHKVTFTHYTHIFKDLPAFFIYFKNSIIVTGISLMFVLVLSSLAGYSFGRREFWGKKFLYIFLLIALDMPYAIYLVPVYIMEDSMGIINTRLGLILPYIALNLSFAIFIMSAWFREMPRDLEDAAKIDGCNTFQLWIKIMLPLAVPALVSVATITFVMVWEEFMFVRTLSTTVEAQTLPVGIPLLKREAQSWAYGTLSAVLVLSFIPVIAIFLITQKYFVKGFLRGSIKE